MTFGITVLPEWAQSEGIENLLDRLQRAHVTDIATSPYVMQPDSNGTREPPVDGGAGKVRLLERELWGHRELSVRTAPSFHPDHTLYETTRYKPPKPDDLTEREGHVVQEFIDKASARGMKVWFQVQSAIPPGYRVQFGGPASGDACLGPDSQPGPDRVDSNASLAAPDVIAYGEAMMQDLARAYPGLAGIRLDWPEYPPYHFHALFFDFSPHALQVATQLDLDIERMRHDARALQTRLTRDLDAELLSRVCHLDRNSLDVMLQRYPGMLDMLRLRRHLSLALIQRYRQALPASLDLVPQAFPPPFNLLSGFDFGAASEVVQGIGIKLYTMHWPMIAADYARAMSAGKASASKVAEALLKALDISDQVPPAQRGFAYPEPDENHTASADNIRRKITAAKQQSGNCPVYAFSHAYGPCDDMLRRAQAAWQASEGNMWVNRYGYLSNEKLEALGLMVSR
ncbi:hypothetical protein ACUNV4_02355 [Granulosicoccus sp. 3-233]|uniref:hypothetical protein n=1 Tax=Granulosicoccus sp. 3-233 TaxID=3417969 RepID=UPI003D342437